MTGEFFSRQCSILNENGKVENLLISFFAPEYDQHLDVYTAKASVVCEYFNKDLILTGEDAAQAFFFLPIIIVAYLMGKRREGYEAYWSEPGDLDFTNFWTYQR